MASCRALCRASGRIASAPASARHFSAPPDTHIPPAKRKYVPSSGTYPKGFLAASAHVGIKASNTSQDDLALLVSETPCAAAGMFTKNRFKAAPVIVDKDILGPTQSRDGIRAVIVNSGCANAVTGAGGIEDAKTMSDTTDKLLPQIETESGHERSSLVMSTGVIGQRLPISKIVSQIPTAVSALGNSHNNWLSVARAICTTDTFPKLITRQFSLPSFPDETFNMAGMTKGAGMIHPNMGTLLSMVCTDAPIEAASLGRALGRAVDQSFNSISIDGDTSTNDTILLLANGAATPHAKRDAISGQLDSNDKSDFSIFSEQLASLCKELAQLVVRDGEGATKFVTIRVRGAQRPGVGKRIASTIATSPLVKTALYGKDANWGRILCAIGYAEGDDLDADISPKEVSVSFVPANSSETKESGDALKLLVKGEPQEVDETRAAEMLAEDDLEIVVDLGGESASGSLDETVFWTCDFSHEYVTINGDYRT